MHAPSRDHEHFNAICARIDEWEPLPTIRATPPETPEDGDGHEQAAPLEQAASLEQAAAGEEAAPLDEVILAGLVCPV